MRLIGRVFIHLSNIIHKYSIQKKDPRSYFDFSAEEKKKIINKAAKEAIAMQASLLKEYEEKFVKHGQEKYFYRT